MNAQVPPNLFCIVDAVCFNKQFDKVFIRFNTFKIFRNAGARELIKYLGAKRFISCNASLPERRICTERINMRKKIPGGVGDMIGHLAAFHSNVHMQTKNEVAARSFLQFIYNFVVPCVICDELAFPMAEWMCA